MEWVPQLGDGWGHRLVGGGQGSGGWEGTDNTLGTPAMKTIDISVHILLAVALAVADLQDSDILQAGRNF